MGCQGRGGLSRLGWVVRAGVGCQDDGWVVRAGVSCQGWVGCQG